MHERNFEDVTVICVTYQSRALVEALAAQLQPFPQVIVVDNGSTDGTVAAVRRLIPQARVLQRNHNGGFGRANNEAMAHVLTPFALLLNPDCRLAPEALDILRQCMHRYPLAGVVAPQGWRADRRPQKSFRAAFYERQQRQPYRTADATCSVQWLNGCCLLVRTHAFREIGGFDEQFFLFYEDDDLCLRMRQAGYECLIEPAASALHTGGASSAASLRTSLLKAFHYARSRHLAICKYQGRPAGYRYLAKILLAAPLLALAYGVLLQRRRAIKWLAWGAAAACGLGTKPQAIEKPTNGPYRGHHPARRTIEPVRRAPAPRPPRALHEDRRVE
jgi:GT2 family glycosyltransferase